MPLSAAVNAGDDATAAQYNNARLDALNLRAQAGAVTISGGAVTVTASYSYYVVSAESGTTDDLATVTAGTGIAAGDMVMLIADAGDYIQCTVAGNLDRVAYLTGEHSIIIRYNGTSWDVVRHSGCGYKKVVIPISAMRPLDTGGCSALVQADGTVVRWFDGAADESANISLAFPSGWSGILKFRVSWKCATTDAGNVLWFVTTENAVSTEVFAGGTTTTLAASAAGETANEVSVTAISDAHTAGEDGDRIDLYLGRDADAAGDTYDAHDAGAFLLEVFYLMYSDGIEEV